MVKIITRRREAAEKAQADPGSAGSEPAQSAAAGVEPEERTRRIAFAAYLRAEARGFAPGCELDDGLEAERQVDEEIGAAANSATGPRAGR